MRRDQRGQGLVEIAIALPVFLILMMGVFDFGRAIYQYNAVSQAAREIARVTSVHPGGSLGTDPLIAPVVATQQGLVPGLSAPTFTCVDTSGNPVVAPVVCDYSKHSVLVTVTSPYTPLTPVLGLLGTWTMTGSSTAQIQ